VHSKPREIIVVGGGIIGTTCALQLQAQGIATILIDKQYDSKTASWGNIGHIATEQIEPLASRKTLKSLPRRLFIRGGPVALPISQLATWVPFAYHFLKAARTTQFSRGCQTLAALSQDALKAWQNLLIKIRATELLKTAGHFVAWESSRSAAIGHDFWSQAATGVARACVVTAEEMHQLQNLCTQPISGAIRFEGTGHIVDLNALHATLRSAFIASGGSYVLGTVEKISPSKICLENKTTFETEAVLLCAGVWSADLLRPLGYRVPLIAERGYHIHSELSAWPIDFPPVVFEDRALMATRFRNGLRVSSFVEFGQVSAAADIRKWQRLRSHVAELGLPFNLPGNPWYGARPTLPDYLPAMGRSRIHPWLYYAFGHQHLGLTLAATTSDWLTELICCGSVNFSHQDALVIERFQ
jgi:D-hydroxyproline dehydrogenase